MHLTELENRLYLDMSNETRDLLLERLAAARATLSLQLGDPLKPADYETLTALVAGCDAATSVVKTLARRYRQWREFEGRLPDLPTGDLPEK